MGKNLSEKQAKEFKELMGWNDNDCIDFKTFCGICALCERLLAASRMPGKKVDPCHEVIYFILFYFCQSMTNYIKWFQIETADFESLNRRLDGKQVDERLVRMLFAIKDS